MTIGGSIHAHDQQAAYLRTLQMGQRDPVSLTRGILPSHVPEPWQAVTLRSVWANPRTAVVCCNGAGKTFVAAQAALTFMECFPPAIIITTAGSWNQVRRQLWKELRTQYYSLPAAYQLGEMNTTDWTVADDWYCIGFSTNNPGLFEGFHNPHVLVILDEAKSITPEIYDSVNRIFSGRGRLKRVLQLSTPGESMGRHYDAFHDHASRWARISVNPFTASYSIGERTIPIPPTLHVSDSFAREMLEEYGEDNPIYRSMVLALWSEASAYQLFGVSQLASMKQPVPVPEERTAVSEYMGADVARSTDGDESVLYHVTDCVVDGEQHHIIGEFDAFRTADAEVYADRLIMRAQEWGVPAPNVNVDGVGIGGPVCDILRRRGWHVNEVQSGASPTRSSPRMSNVRTEMWVTAAEMARLGAISGLEDERTSAQLSEPRYGYDGQDRMQVEPKKDTWTRLRRTRPSSPWHSPDRGDGVLLGLYRRKGGHVPAWKMAGG